MTRAMTIRAAGLACAPTTTPAAEPLEGRRLLSASFVTQHNLVSDGAVPADHVDANLKNPWGLAADDDGGPLWVANNGTHTATIYDFATGDPAPLVVDIRGANNGHGAPTGQVYNEDEDGFVVHFGGRAGAATFLFAGEDGTVSAWAPGVNLTRTVVVANRTRRGSVYKGLAQAEVNGRHYIYATDFANGGVDVWDDHFRPVVRFGRFVDPQVPRGYAPFGIQEVDGNLVVTYARKQYGSEDEAHGAGLGYVTVFRPNGQVLRRLQHTSLLNAPWGVAKAPAGWGEFAGDLLVGQFGSGTVVAYDPHTGESKGTLHRQNGNPVVNEGLWGLYFGNTPQTASTLFFDAGINDEADGLLGTLTVHRGT